MEKTIGKKYNSSLQVLSRSFLLREQKQSPHVMYRDGRINENEAKFFKTNEEFC